MSDPIPPEKLRVAISESLWEHVKSYDLADVCVGLGLEPERPNEDPGSSKRIYVKSRLLGKSLGSLVEIARKVVEEYGDEDLERLLAQIGPKGVSGDLKNLIFAANGPKPRIILRDAINNVIEIVENEQFCLVYDQPLEAHGLNWREMVAWWAGIEGRSNDDEVSVARDLYARLAESLASSPEELLFRTYCERYGSEGGFELPALIPQVYLHYDPYTKRELRARQGEELPRQRMDFLLLLPGRTRVVIEVDGVQHYSKDGLPDTAKYAEMVSEDRRLGLAGYEVYRFGGHELTGPGAATVVNTFFDDLLARHAPSG